MKVAQDKIGTTLASSGQQESVLSPKGVGRSRAAADALFKELRAISLRSAERLRSHEVLTDADLYDEAGVPEGPRENT